MHILIIITDFGSFNVFLSDLAVKMVQSGHKVDVICSHDKVIDIEDKFDYKNIGVNIHFISFPRGFNIYWQLIKSIKINQLIKKINPDFVHIHFTTGIFTTVFFKKPSYYTIGTFHGLGFPMLTGFKKYLFKVVEFFCFNRLDKIWVLNKFDYDIIQGKNKIKTSMLDSAGVGCDLVKFKASGIDSANNKLKDQLKINDKDFIITYTGRFVSFKGFDLVIKSFLEINKKYPSTFKLMLIGGNDPIHKSGLTESEEKEFLECENILKIGFTNQVEKFLEITDVFLFPSLKEGMPVCIIEALAMGVPVITANSRGCNDLVVDQKNGLVLSQNPTKDEVIEAIIKLKESPELMKDIRFYNLKNRNKLGREVYIEKQIAAYEKL